MVRSWLDWNDRVCLLQARSDEGMSVPRVNAFIALIQAGLKSAGADGEEAHRCEDWLWQQVLAAIAAGCEDAPALARAVLQTTALAFPRWYA